MSTYQEISKLEVDVLLIFYNFSDQFGVVDIDAAKQWASQKLGVIIPDTPFTLKQHHLDILMELGAIPDTRSFLSICKKKRRKRSLSKRNETDND